MKRTPKTEVTEHAAKAQTFDFPGGPIGSSNVMRMPTRVIIAPMTMLERPRPIRTKRPKRRK